MSALERWTIRPKVVKLSWLCPEMPLLILLFGMVEQRIYFQRAETEEVMQEETACSACCCDWQVTSLVIPLPCVTFWESAYAISEAITCPSVYSQIWVLLYPRVNERALRGQLGWGVWLMKDSCSLGLCLNSATQPFPLKVNERCSSTNMGRDSMVCAHYRLSGIHLSVSYCFV